MPHYANGRVASVGDLVINVPKGSTLVTLGVLLDITPGSTSCNGQLLPLARKYADGVWRQVSTPYNECITIGELHPMVAEMADAAVPAKPPETVPA